MQNRAGRGLGEAPAAGLPRPGGGGGSADDAERLAKQGAEQLGREARELKESAKQSASDAADKVKEVAGQTAEQAKRQAGHLAAQVRAKGVALIDQQRSRVADLLEDCVAATRRAAQKLHDENDHNLAGYADAFAGGLESTGRYLREQDARDLVDDAADLARRRPEWVLGGAFVVGLAVARFLKASRPQGAAYGSYRYDRPQEFGGGGGEGGWYGGSYGTGYGYASGGGYAGGGVREYGSPGSGSGDAFGQRPDPGPGLLADTAPGVLDTPGVTTTATGSWAATGAGPTGTAPAAASPDPAMPRTTPFATDLDPARRDNPGDPLT